MVIFKVLKKILYLSVLGYVIYRDVIFFEIMDFLDRFVFIEEFDV